MLASARTLCIDTARRVLPASALMQLRSLMVRRLSGGHGDVFEQIYRRNIWGYQETVSGAGSTLSYTRTLRAALPSLLRELNVQILLDLPCGDFNWMSQVDLPVSHYIGADIVGALVADMQARYGAPHREFRILDICSDPLPDADLLLCRDCFIHLAEDMVFRALSNIVRSNIKYVLMTTYPGGQNRAIRTGDWHPINLQQAPYNLPAPLKVIEDWEPPFDERHLGLWDVAALRRFAQDSGDVRLAAKALIAQGQPV
jgi:hypothetical protein